MSSNNSVLEQVVQSLAQVDAFHSRDPVESLEAVANLAEAWKSIVLHHPEAFSALIDTPNGRVTVINSISVVTACVNRVMHDIQALRVIKEGSDLHPGGTVGG